jgi:hypothetical protein
MKSQRLMLGTVAFLLVLTGCTRTADNRDLDSAVQATLGAIATFTQPVAAATDAPNPTPAVTEEPTLPLPTETPAPLTDAEQITAALVAYVGNNIDPATVVVSDINGDIARGGLPGAYFIAARDAGAWIIVYAGQSTPYCNMINPYSFPVTWVSQCLNDDGTLFNRTESGSETGIAGLGNPTWKDTMDGPGRWYLVDTSTTKFSFDGGYLTMTAFNAGGLDEWGLGVSADLTDFYLELSVKMGPSCSGLDRYGIIFRAPDPGQGYVYEFSCDGRYRLYKWDGDSYTGVQEWKANAAIVSGENQVNRQGVMVEGNTAKLYANGKLLGEYTLDAYPKGRIGLVVGSKNTANFKALVDTATFWNLAGN